MSGTRERWTSTAGPIGRVVGVWRDRFGREHPEHEMSLGTPGARMRRVAGVWERAWNAGDANVRLAMINDALARPNPIITDIRDGSGDPEWMWLVRSEAARVVLLWTNAVFDHDDPRTAEMRRLPGTDVWVITLQLPTAARMMYRIGFWDSDDEPSWRRTEGRRPTLLAAMGATGPDPRSGERIADSRGVATSVAAGPDAPAEPWRTSMSDAVSDLEAVDVDAGVDVWVYRPPGGDAAPTPLMIAFDGERWIEGLDLPRMLDAAITSGLLPPLHVLFVGAGTTEHRWDNLGVPGGQTDLVLDTLLPLVRREYPVSGAGVDTIVVGQSLGGIGALWTLALSAGEVGHAIAQSPSLWRFAVAEALLADDRWISVQLQAGTYEGDMLPMAQGLADALRADPRLGERRVEMTTAVGGHDWTVWRSNLFHALVGLTDAAQCRGIEVAPTGCPALATGRCISVESGEGSSSP